MATEAPGNDRKTPRRDQLISQADLAAELRLSTRMVRTYAGRKGWSRWFDEGVLKYEKAEVRPFIESRQRPRRAS